jgi:hypothetical protein
MSFAIALNVFKGNRNPAVSNRQTKDRAIDPGGSMTQYGRGGGTSVIL